MKRWIVGITIFLLVLSGCGTSENQEERSPLAEAAGVAADEIFLQVDGDEQPAWRYLYWLARDCAQLQEQYEQADLPLDWDAPLEGGGTLADYAKEQALEDTALYAVVEHWAEQYGCEAEKSSESANAQTDPLLTAEQAAKLSGIGRSYGRLYALYCTPDSTLAPVEGELSLFAAQNGQIQVDRIFVADRGDRNAARQKAEELFARFNNASDQAETFTALAAAGDDPVGPRTLESDPFEAPLQEAAQALESGQYSGILESLEGFSILRRMPENMEDIREAYFDYLLQCAAEKSQIQTMEAYEKLSVGSFYTALTAAKKR